MINLCAHHLIPNKEEGAQLLRLNKLLFIGVICTVNNNFKLFRLV